MQFSRYGRDSTPSTASLTYLRWVLLSTPNAIVRRVNNVLLEPLFVGFAGAVVVAIVARRLRMLTTEGAIAAAIIGTIVYGFGGWSMTGLLLLFFVSSSLLTQLQAPRKVHPEHPQGRLAGQVLANGAVAAAIAVWHSFNPSSMALSAFAGSVAASTADTWATEIGILSSVRPRLIITWKQVPTGSSGAVTLLGTIGGIVGAIVISLAASYWMGTSLVGILAAGIVAMIVDSLLGATIEGRVQFMDNNGVNFAATIVGAVLGILLG